MSVYDFIYNDEELCELLYNMPVKDYKKDTAKLLLGASKNLAQMVASQAFEFWSRKDFRLYVNFQNLSQTEQDRMFNELEVSLLGLFVLHLDYAQSVGKEVAKIVLKTMQKELIQSFLVIFLDAGVEEKYVKQWRQLIDMRLTEYRKDLKAAIKHSSSWKELGEDETIRHTWALIETITIDCLTHLRRGNVEEKDPLWKLLRKWFISLDANLLPIIQLSQEDSG